MKNKLIQLASISLITAFLTACVSTTTTTQKPAELRSTGDMGVIIERATGQVQIVDHTDKRVVS